ncbi:hypothetical protein DFA_04378 [Cavenderia fasciculata]|uniref:Uncharacterized protein n=1 Tax=Cavenderia fasciculata TaxID=261658 RepID=F4PPE7_CACFS|nr:uncharacterized protein DFA_04378 [Cavenderia fasciculata]EGG22260.1 hypothetical protein DFA_04378 [Cavenderia fasciculata]|eukprot:XP_004360111.1 hypothetical protein DFA_04378 [Cavenderia fasciculata]
MADESDNRVLPNIELEDRLVSKNDMEMVQCCICLGILQNSRQCKSGHLFCLDCIKPIALGVNRGKRSCPQCRIEINLDQLNCSLLAENMTKDLKIYCINHFHKENILVGELLCDEIIKIGDLESDIHQLSCKFNRYKCPNGGCDHTFLKPELEDHLEECKFRIVSCQYCQQEFKLSNMVFHEQFWCPEMNEQCQYGCRQTYIRKKKEDHLAECPNQKVECPFGKAQCSFIGMRKDMNDHINESISTHISGMNQSFNQKLKLLTDENIKLSLELKDTNESIKHLIEQNKAKGWHSYEWTINKDLIYSNDRVFPFSWKSPVFIINETPFQIHLINYELSLHAIGLRATDTELKYKFQIQIPGTYCCLTGNEKGTEFINYIKLKNSQMSGLFIKKEFLDKGIIIIKFRCKIANNGF